MRERMQEIRLTDDPSEPVALMERQMRALRAQTEAMKKTMGGSGMANKQGSMGMTGTAPHDDLDTHHAMMQQHMEMMQQHIRMMDYGMGDIETGAE
ncbi:MAG: hypothetical protein WBG92_14115 [Thiohalocapsa sp.]